MSPLRVSIDVSAVPARPAGAGRYTIELLTALTGHDEVARTLICRRHDEERWRTIDPSSRVVGIVPGARPARLTYERFALSRQLRSLGVEVHHGPHYTMPRGSSIPTVVTIHDVTFFERPEVHERAKVLFFRRAISEAARRATVLVCVSQRTASKLVELVEVAAPIVVAPHGIDHRRFTHEEPWPGADLATIGGLGLRPDRRRVLSVGTLEPRKGLRELLHAFEEVSADHLDLDLVVAGQRGWGMDEFDAELAASPVRDRIRLLGYVADEAIPALLRTAAVVAYPSIDEGFGLPALEGLACGAAVVTTEGSVMAELCGSAPWLVAPGDAEALAAGIAEVLSAPVSERDRRREIGRITAADFTWEVTAARHVEAYELARQRGPTVPKK